VTPQKVPIYSFKLSELSYLGTIRFTHFPEGHLPDNSGDQFLNFSSRRVIGNRWPNCLRIGNSDKLVKQSWGRLARSAAGNASGCDLRASRLPEKSKSGIATPKRELDLIQQRLAEAEWDYRNRQN
jgi:hypothetical protein